nr:hypothetical protein [Betaproteobacteria bacterium]
GRASALINPCGSVAHTFADTALRGHQSAEVRQTWFHRLWKAFAFTPLSNMCGTPAISMPMERQANGLPFGIQALAPQSHDGLLLQLAAQIERSLAKGWNQGALPDVHISKTVA